MDCCTSESGQSLQLIWGKPAQLLNPKQLPVPGRAVGAGHPQTLLHGCDSDRAAQW